MSFYGHPTQTRTWCKIRFYYGYTVEILRDNVIKYGCSIQCNHTNDIMFKNIQN